MSKIIGVEFGIDCDPFQQRPEVYAVDVFEKLGVGKSEPYSELFGAWRWQVAKEMTEEAWQEFNDWIKSHMDNLYQSDKIRGAVWSKCMAE